MKKNITSILLVVVLLGVGGFIAFKAMNNKNEFQTVSDYVKENKKELENIAKEYIKGNKVEYLKDIKSVENKKQNGDNLVYFTLKDSSDNSGFYYTEKNEPTPDESGIDLIELGNDKYKWVDKDGNDKGETTKIVDNWYYYKNNNK